jgi:hypothetical protein
MQNPLRWEKTSPWCGSCLVSMAFGGWLMLSGGVCVPAVAGAEGPDGDQAAQAKASFQDPAAKVQAGVAGGSKLAYTPEHGYLESVLKQLEIPISSQVLVFSKTSMQMAKISPRTPRAIYFNDDSYVGWIPEAEVIEIMSTDPERGQVFYTVNQDQTVPPALVRDRGNCLACHDSSRTQNVPGVLTRSVVVNSTGRPEFSAGTFNTDHRSPFGERWGGWYVTGEHGAMRHMGNVTTVGQSESGELDTEAGANVTDLSKRFSVSNYLSPHSDIVALMVLGHQGQMHNLMTSAAFECNAALNLDRTMNEALQRPADYQSESTQRRIATAGDRLLQYLLFCNECPLASPVRGTSAFTQEFQQRGPFDSRGRSLRDFDLKTRLFQYPCSYLIYSSAFDQLPAPMKSHVTRRLHAILVGEDHDAAYAHLNPADRRAILEILQETKPDLFATGPTALSADNHDRSSQRTR